MQPVNGYAKNLPGIIVVLILTSAGTADDVVQQPLISEIPSPAITTPPAPSYHHPAATLLPAPSDRSIAQSVDELPQRPRLAQESKAFKNHIAKPVGGEADTAVAGSIKSGLTRPAADSPSDEGAYHVSP